MLNFYDVKFCHSDKKYTVNPITDISWFVNVQCIYTECQKGRFIIEYQLSNSTNVSSLEAILIWMSNAKNFISMVTNSVCFSHTKSPYSNQALQTGTLSVQRCRSDLITSRHTLFYSSQYIAYLYRCEEMSVESPI